MFASSEMKTRPARRVLHSKSRNPKQLCHSDRSEAKRAQWRNLLFSRSEMKIRPRVILLASPQVKP